MWCDDDDDDATESTRNNVFYSVDCWWHWKEPVIQCVGSEKKAGFSLADVQWCLSAFKHAHNRFLHWPTASTFCDMLDHVL